MRKVTADQGWGPTGFDVEIIPGKGGLYVGFFLGKGALFTNGPSDSNHFIADVDLLLELQRDNRINLS